MRFHENDAAQADVSDVSKWARRPTLKNVARDHDVVHHNTLNARAADADDVERSREVERFFDLMTSTAATATRQETLR